ncbi:beta family protein [Escherichia coli]|uniref:beta family protein n=1 Tax=Escherichia coli TaxID=562 RepID=UPI000BDEA741|nr:hypothetical protein [Escherichia coli]
MSQHQYYPQLKWKPAEYESLMLLDQTTLSGFTPIITIPDIDWDYENECYKKSLSSYLSDFGINLAASWKANRPVLLDVVTNGAIVIHTQRLKSDPGGNLLS